MVDVQNTISSVNGFRVAGIHAGLKSAGALDFSLFVSDTDCVTGAVFTTNLVKAACVTVDMAHVQASRESIRAVVINTKYANACTGELGVQNAERTAQLLAEKLRCEPEQVLVLSTGVIGTQLPMDKIEHGLTLSYDALGNDWESAAKGMLTTDTHHKMASADVTLSSGQTVHIAGVSKGSGMIAPNMATMLGVIVTDAALTSRQAQSMLSAANTVTFNRIVVDGDMSTNDTVFLLANGASSARLASDADEAAFQEALTAVARKLAQDIVRDGEGVTKFVTIAVRGAGSDDGARQIANTIATSALVKTAFFGSDANWGRVIAAAGRAGVRFDPNLAKLHLWSGEDTTPPPDAVELFADAMPTDYSEADATAAISQPAFVMQLDCGLGDGEAVIWTCDLSYDYVKINGDYRT